MEGRAWTVRSNGRKALNASLGHSLRNSQLAEDPKSPLSSFKMSAPECIWKHFPKLEPWPEVGAGLHLERMCVSASVSGCKQTGHTSFHHGILIRTLTLCYFYIWTMSLHLDEIEMFRFVAQASTTAKALIRHSFYLHISRAKWTDKIFSINWWKVYQKSFILLYFWCLVCLSFPMMRKIITMVGLELALWKIKPAKSPLFVTVTMYLAHHYFSLLGSYLWTFLGFESMFTCHC